jgi:hypothetical protein
MNETKSGTPAYPLPITRWLEAAERLCDEGDGAACHEAVLGLADAVIYYLGAVAVGQYSQALYTEQIEPDPTLNRSLRSLRRILPGQWLGWVSRGLAATGAGSVAGLAEWYSGEQSGPVAEAYSALREIMVEHLAYTGEYGARERASPRQLLELIDQYRIRRGKMPIEALPADIDRRVADALLPGLRTMLATAGFLTQYELYAPVRRQLLMGSKAVSPMPPISAPTDAAATILLYPPGEAPDYTKRPNLQAERVPLFPLDPLLAYLYCPQCDSYQVAALQEVAAGVPSYLGLDPECGHVIQG